MKSKFLIILLITILTFFMVFSNCSIITDRWAIEWDNYSTGAAAASPNLKIYNNTDEIITSVKYYVGDNPPSDWSNQARLTGNIPPSTSITYSIGTSGASITLPSGGNNTIWIKVAADNYFQSQLFAQDGFLYESGDHLWIATIHKEK